MTTNSGLLIWVQQHSKLQEVVSNPPTTGSTIIAFKTVKQAPTCFFFPTFPSYVSLDWRVQRRYVHRWMNVWRRISPFHLQLCPMRIICAITIIIPYLILTGWILSQTWLVLEPSFSIFFFFLSLIIHPSIHRLLIHPFIAYLSIQVITFLCCQFILIEMLSRISRRWLKAINLHQFQAQPSI